jgi:uncharacterized membrane protein
MKLDRVRTPGAGRAANIGLGALYLIAAASVAGFGVFRAWPMLLNSPSASAIYPRAFELFPRVQIVLAFAVLAIVLVAHAGWRWVAPFAAIYAVSLGSELLGTTSGFPFGAYEYTHLLGPKLFEHVPVLIPISWFTMALPSYALARRVMPSAASVIPSAARDLQFAGVVRRVLIASLLLLAWDLSLDPAMSGATSYWIWGSQGAYYGMPFTNLIGWFVTGLALMTVLAWFRADEWIDRLPRRWIAAYYGANIALPLGMALAAGMWLAALATLGALGVCAVLVRGRGRVPRLATGRLAVR